MARKKGAVVAAKSEDTKSKTDNPLGEESTVDKEVDSSEAVKDQTSEVKARKVKNIARAGQTVFGATGAPVIFNSEGIAEGATDDLEYLLTVPGYKAV